MKRVGLTAAFLLAATAAAAAANVRNADSPSAARCGGALWRLMTLSDSGRASVRLTPPASTTIGAIGKRPSPLPVPTTRRTSFQRQSWEVVAQLTTFRLERGGIRLVLFDSNSYMNAVIPTPACLSARTRARKQIAQVWKQFADECARAKSDWQPLGAIVYVQGVGFWSQRQEGQRGAAPNGAELRPVTGLRIVSGC
jgi:hypothetical protein